MNQGASPQQDFVAEPSEPDPSLTWHDMKSPMELHCGERKATH